MVDTEAYDPEAELAGYLAQAEDDGGAEHDGFATQPDRDPPSEEAGPPAGGKKSSEEAAAPADKEKPPEKAAPTADKEKPSEATGATGS